MTDGQHDDSALAFEGASKTFGSFVAVDDVTLRVGPREKLAIMGPSGSGKTTMLRLAMTLEPLTMGSIEVRGHQYDKDILDRKNRHNLREVRSAIGMVFQQFNLFQNKTAIENIALPLRRVKHLSKDEAQERARALLDRVGLSPQAHSFPRQLSGGQAQRVAIARALALEPTVLLFDEPTSALDPELVGEVLAVIRDVAATTNAAMVLVTHELAFATEIADRLVLMEAGRIVEEGPVDRMLSDPQQHRTREFFASVTRRSPPAGSPPERAPDSSPGPS
jgi:polar amino acid transport system ATP-binding protein